MPAHGNRRATLRSATIGPPLRGWRGKRPGYRRAPGEAWRKQAEASLAAPRECPNQEGKGKAGSKRAHPLLHLDKRIAQPVPFRNDNDRGDKEPARRRDREQKSKRLCECRVERRYVHVRSPSAAPASEGALLESVPRLWIARPGPAQCS